MNLHSDACDEVDLALLLEGDDGSPVYQRVARHVDTCPECQGRLTELSADAGHWLEQREMLRPLAGDDTESGLIHRFRSADSMLGRRNMVDPSLVAPFLAPPSHPEMLGRLGRYEIERILGSGGMGIVLKGFDSDLHRPVAIKLLAPHLARVGAARQRFAREARAAAAVVHEHVVPIHSVESDNAVPFLVMKLISGESLQARVERDGPLSVREILRIGLQAASGLAAAHAQGLIHRDVKPANIMLENGVERAYLTDFGLARASHDASLTCTGVLAGTPHYMSPEQADGRPLDHRSDLFSLGSVLYFMATGFPPFRAASPMAVLKRTCHDPHRPVTQFNAEIPPALSSIIDRLLEKHPSRRFNSASELQQALAELLSAVQQGKLARRRWYPPARLGQLLRGTVGKTPFVILTSVCLLAATGFGIALSGWFRVPLRPDQSAAPPGSAPAAISPPEEASSETPAAPSSARTELLQTDPQPAAEAQRELETLNDLLNGLEARPFPETELFGDRP